MKFHQDALDDCLYGDSETLKKVSYDFADKGRWRSNYWLIFKFGDEFFGVVHEEGNDENCDCTPWDADADGMVECTELFEAHEVKTVYATQEQIDKSDGKIRPAQG
jgi:hypothetical protein